MCRLPVMDRDLPIIGDEYVQREFGTGALKITPAHDPNDFEIGLRHGLEQISVMDEAGMMNELAGKYQGQSAMECREHIVEDLKKAGLLEKIEPYKHMVGHCQRCRTVIEPSISKQWFVKIKPLAEEAMRVVREGKTRIVPTKWENDYFVWMENLRDWCISRQLWWGHRIPAYYCQDCGEIMVDFEQPEKCSKCSGGRFEQDTDVLDTWFSSALWPFSTMGWPEKTPELAKYYPTSLLVTGFDILTFWVSRMLMMGVKFMGDVPFKDVYIHALVRDIDGRKMSKSLGNVIDPLEVIDEYGADAFRYALAAFAAQGRDIKLSKDRIEGYRNFMNKIWNASRFVFMNLDEDSHSLGVPSGESLSVVDRWILSRLTKTIQAVREHIEAYRFNEAAGAVYQFLWHEYCDWYLEWIKGDLYHPERPDDRKRVQGVMIEVLKQTVQLLHPFAPYITEELWEALPGTEGSVMYSVFPKAEDARIDEGAEAEIELLMGIVGGIRNLRSEMNVPPGIKTPVTLIPDADHEEALKRNSELINVLARTGELTVDASAKRPPMAVYALVDRVEIHMPMEGIVDLEKEEARLMSELEAVEKDVSGTVKKLANENFVQKAPANVVEGVRRKAEELKLKQEKIQEGLSRIREVLKK